MGLLIRSPTCLSLRLSKNHRKNILDSNVPGGSKQSQRNCLKLLTSTKDLVVKIQLYQALDTKYCLRFWQVVTMHHHCN